MSGPYPRKPKNSGGGMGTPAGRLADIAAQEAEGKQLESVRAAAEKWAGAIATIVGLFALSGIIKGPDDFAKVDTFWQPWIPIALAIAVSSGLVATVLAARAAYGLPKLAWMVGSLYIQARVEAARKARQSLNTAIGAAIVSFAAFAFAVGVLWFSPRAAPSVSLTLLTTSTTLVCGQLKSITSSGITIADVVSGRDVTTISSDVQLIETVSACPVVSK